MLDPTRMEDVLRRGGEVATLVGSWKSIDERRRKLQAELDTLRQQRNSANDEMKKLDKKSPEFAAALPEMKNVSTQIKLGEAQLAQLGLERYAQLLAISSAPNASVPDGAGEADNPVVNTW